MIAPLHAALLPTAFILCFLMTWGVGANDLANVMSTTMGSKSTTLRRAILIAIIFEFAGAFLGGQGVTETMRDGIIDTSPLTEDPLILITGMISVLASCTLWMTLASVIGVPISITNALVGAMVGFGSLVLGLEAIQWGQVQRIAMSWVISPVLAGLVGYGLFVSLQLSIFARSDPLSRAKRVLPVYLFLIGGILSFITVFKGLAHFHIILTGWHTVFVMLVSSSALTGIGILWIRALPPAPSAKRHVRFMQVEKYFSILMTLTACAMVFAHGSNDVSLAIGPLSIVYNLTAQVGEPMTATNYPYWITLLGCSGVIVGFLMYGRRVIETVGSDITALTPSRAFCATLAAAATVVLSTSTGIPVSATQTLVGAVLGVGLARGIGALNLIVIRNIILSWILTLPAVCLLTIGCYSLLRFFLH